ncbi:phosphoribosylanthranilate isomerase [Phreatobacter stygius]|uniref:N-(5'-phosphoribosyl)anthranilate isomerase n=1 Tax=Phreatobacter stygius TaxID=1940610 RepID=A0A4D7BA59_9HYPH|nr:phosphoribosylanthranilate isomerase [Phreatobacter stygius]QCI64972.1 phosphoribosylanthranilate isomerase [Phreatobacter stygius]
MTGATTTIRTRVKICCISSVAEARMAIAAGADALGFVAAMPSGPGIVDDATIRSVTTELPPPIASFLLTARVRGLDIADHIRACGTNTVQIVDHIDPAELAVIAVALPMVRRVQVIHVEGPQALDLIPTYEPYVHAFLLDSGKPGGTMRELGGTGRTHDWAVSREFVARTSRPVFLAGGLNAGNAIEAIARVKPFGLDLCSGVRTNGHLDQAKLTAFMQAVRSTA